MTQSYKTGTVTVAAGSDIVVGSGTAWALALVTGGLFCCAGISVPCTVVDDTHLKLDYPWPGANGAGLSYSIFRETAQAASAVTANDRLAEIADRLNKQSYINFDAMGTLAQRAAYDTAPKDFIFLDVAADPFELYVKKSDAAGDWAGPNVYGQGAQGPKGDQGDPGPEGPQGEPGRDGDGAGDVVGPSSAQEGEIVLFDGATGKLIKGSGKGINDLIPADGSISNAKLADMAAARLKGRVLAGNGSPEDLTAAQAWNVLGITPNGNLYDRLRDYARTDFTDANTCLEFGLYKNSSGSAANIPTANSGAMLVIPYSVDNLTQIWTRTIDGAEYRRKRVAGAFGPWEQMFGQRNVVGTVSQAGGTPTGAIVEGGSNANGDYIKLADGTQICTVNNLSTDGNSTAIGSLWRGTSNTFWTFPVAFVTGSNVAVSAGQFATASNRWASVVSSSTTGANLNQWSTTSFTVPIPISAMAIGRWY